MRTERASTEEATSSTDDAVDHVGRRLRTLEQCALHRRTLRLTCPACRHVRLIDAIPLWWLFVQRGWDDGLPAAVQRLYCRPCRDAGRLIRPLHLVTRQRPEGPQPRYPSEREWKRIVSRHRS